MRFFLHLIFWGFAITELKSQQIVFGQITDEIDGTPICLAEIFIANSTIGTITDDSGNYQIKVPVKGAFEIVVNHVGYLPVVLKIDNPAPLHKVDISMKTNELTEIVVTARRNYRQRDVSVFWNKLLGERPSSRRIEVLNAEKVYYFRNSDNVLKVSCKEPIKIINHEMGYLIWYVLDSFQHDYNSGSSTIFGSPYFMELIPEGNRQKTNWEKKRKEVYNISINRFLRCLYQRKLNENGFLITKKDSVWYANTTFPLDNILQMEQDKVQLKIETPLLLACISRPVTDQMILNTWDTLFGPNSFFPITILLPQHIYIYSDGTYSGMLKIQEYRNSINGLKSRLPDDYEDM